MSVASVDLHCHLLPDWDDGPSNLEEALALATAAVDNGIRKILVTPHVGRPLRNRMERPARDIPEATAAFQETLRGQGIDLDLVPGAELTFADADLDQRLREEPWLSVGGQGRYILIESTFGSWPRYANQMLYRLSLAGATAIIAHPERLPDVQKDVSILYEAVEQGAVLQITARSLQGLDGPQVKACCVRLLKAGVVGVVASDAHAAHSIWPSAVQEILESVVGAEEAHRILLDNPRAVLEGRPVVTTGPPREVPPTGLWGKLRGLAAR